MIKICDIAGCGRVAKYFNLKGLSCLCEQHKDYFNYLKPRLLNLRLNCGRKKGDNKNKIIQKFL